MIGQVILQLLCQKLPKTLSETAQFSARMIFGSSIFVALCEFQGEFGP